ncbi:BTB/POZ domain-containing protein At3g08570-like [Lolium rigidum]|uniref:BTB/POZ domain-containing protein At3g08570-like n=1 Tax=Lolium rigidum TaxID=89674 RepID=UPI001F5DD060|nr:BTB/POZ domain-containing protein At3g08570-like [Lolium rigidum]
MGLAGDNAGFPFSAKLSAAPSPRFCNPMSRRIFSDVAGDITVLVDGQSFLLHKFPLVSRCGRIRRMVADSKDPDLSKLELVNVPGGALAFELAAKFCYGSNFEITTVNVAHLRCIAEYLEMTEDYQDENLIVRTEMYLNDLVVKNLEKSLEVLCACDGLDPMVEEVGFVDRCVDAIAMNASKEQLVSGLAHLECDAGSGKLRMHCQDWWVEDLSALRIDYYQRVIAAMRRSGVRPESIGTSIVHYAQTALKCIERRHVWDSGPLVGDNQRVIVETLINLMATEKITAVTLSFLFGMLRMAIEVDAGLDYRIEVEKRIGLHLEMASLDDLLIPSMQTSDSMFDVDTVHRILVNFLQRIEEDDSGDSSPCGYESDGLKSPSHSSVLKVGRLMDGYLAEIAPDPYLKLQKFMTLIELLPDYARIVDDGLYRAIDIYLKAHPSLTESECKKLCKLIDCQKLSQDASSHAAQNDRLPMQMVVRVLYFEQLRLKSSFSGGHGHSGGGEYCSFSQRITMPMSGSGVPSSCVSPRAAGAADSYASLRRENRELKLEVSRMRVRLTELEREQGMMKQGMRDGRPGEHGRAFLASISRGIGRMAMFGPSGERRKKSSRATASSHCSEGKSRRRKKTSVTYA